jgi:hypothetical protein
VCREHPWRDPGGREVVARQTDLLSGAGADPCGEIQKRLYRAFPAIFYSLPAPVCTLTAVHDLGVHSRKSWICINICMYVGR